MSPAANTLRTRLGRRVRALRLQKEWSQETLGAKARLSYKFVGEVERGRANPSLETLEALSDAFQVDVTDLFGLSPAPVVVDDYALTRRESQAAREALGSLDALVRRLSNSRRLMRPVSASCAAW